MIEIVICEDNKHYLDCLGFLLEKIIAENKLDAKIVLKALNMDSVEKFITTSTPRVFFLDINLNSHENGLNLALKIRQKFKNAYIVFISGHLEFVFQSFKSRPFNFIPKPVSKEILENNFLEIYNELIKKDLHEEKVLEIKIGGTFHRLKLSDIMLIERLKNKTLIHAHNKRLECYDSLESIGIKISESTFIRCHRAFICNRNYISQIKLKDKEIHLENGLVCRIGRKYNLRDILGN